MRALLFLFGCIGTRFLLTYLAKTGDAQTRRYIAIFAAMVSIGFITIWLFNLRPEGVEAGGKIWWDNIRPIHAFMYGLFAILVLKYDSVDAWKVLFTDTMMGLTAWGVTRL